MQWAKVPRAWPAHGAPLPYCSSPDSSLDCSVPVLCPADSSVHLFGACLLPLAREPKHHQASSLTQARNQAAASVEPTVVQREPDKAGERVCAWEAALSLEQRSSCPNLTGKEERVPGHLPQVPLPKHSPLGAGADSRSTPKFPRKSKERISAAG